MHIVDGQWRHSPVTQPLSRVALCLGVPPSPQAPTHLGDQAKWSSTPKLALASWAEVVFPLLGSRCAVNSLY